MLKTSVDCSSVVELTTNNGTSHAATPVTALSAVEQKIARLQAGATPRLLDLFSGCGGLSLGFHSKGFQIVASVEMDKDAAKSHALNFHKDSTYFESHARSRDIQKTSPASLFKSLGYAGDVDAQVDVIVGGPPCQAFTRVGRAKLREVFKDDNAFLNDSRSQLYKRYLEYVRQTKPLAILMENVPDMMNYGGINIAELVCRDLVSFGYDCRYTLLNTVYYGVPQMRERMFLIAIHKSLPAEIKFPEPSHYIELPKGYHGSRSVALKHIISEEINPFYFPPPIATQTLTPAVTVEDALSDLPLINSHLKNELKRGTKKLDVPCKYRIAEPVNDYQQLMRQWPKLTTNSSDVKSNVIRLLPRDYPIFKKMKPGDQYPQALKVAHRIFNKKLKQVEKEDGKVPSLNSKKYQMLLKNTIPPYDAGKFPNKWRKMEPDMPSRTLMAHLGKDCYSHIHYDSEQARTISVREAARLQSFPDDFQFCGAMNAAFRQIGNAVPPLMASILARMIKQSIDIALLKYPKKTTDSEV